MGAPSNDDDLEAAKRVMAQLLRHQFYAFDALALDGEESARPSLEPAKDQLSAPLRGAIGHIAPAVLPIGSG